MIFKYCVKEQSFIFQAPSVEVAEEFILMHFNSYSSNPEDGCDYVGNYLSLLSTVDENSGYDPLFKIVR